MEWQQKTQKYKFENFIGSFSTLRRAFALRSILSVPMHAHASWTFNNAAISPGQIFRKRKISFDQTHWIFAKNNDSVSMNLCLQKKCVQNTTRKSSRWRWTNFANQFSLWNCFDGFSIWPNLDESSATWFSCRKIMNLIKMIDFAAIQSDILILINNWKWYCQKNVGNRLLCCATLCQ